MEEKSCKRNCGGHVEAEAPRRYPGSLQEASRRHPGALQEVPRRHPGGSQGHQEAPRPEAPRRQPQTPRRKPRDQRSL